MTARWAGSGLYATALAASAWVAAPGPLYWDSFGYVEQAVVGKVGGLALGRPLFVIGSHAIARAFLGLGGSPWRLERALALAWLLVASLSAPLTASLARRIGFGSRGALGAGFVVALSPLAAHTNAAVLTEGPSLTVALFAIVVATHARARLGRAIAAGAVLGAACALREQALWALVPVAIYVAHVDGATLTRGRRIACALAAALGAIAVAAPLVAWFASTQAGWFDRFPIWIGGMTRERDSHALSAGDLAANLGWLFALGPIALVLAAIAVVRGRLALLHPRARAFPVVAMGLLLVASLVIYPDLATHPRYMLHALPGAIAIPAAWAIENLPRARDVRLALTASVLAIPILVTRPVIAPRQAALVAATDDIPRRVAALPPHAILVTGQPCAALPMYRALSRLDPNASRFEDLETICAGWAWPQPLSERLARAGDRVIVLDLREGAWTPSQTAERRELDAWLEAHAGAEDSLLLWR